MLRSPPPSLRSVRDVVLLARFSSPLSLRDLAPTLLTDLFHDLSQFLRVTECHHTRIDIAAILITDELSNGMLAASARATGSAIGARARWRDKRGRMLLAAATDSVATCRIEDYHCSLFFFSTKRDRTCSSLHCAISHTIPICRMPPPSVRHATNAFSRGLVSF